MKFVSVSGLAAAAFIYSPPANAQGASDKPVSEFAQSEGADQIVITGRRRSPTGREIAASEGTVRRDEIDERPLLRAGDLLEFVPGLVATQHSGSGKANQYFLRGFNLDHGTDFATFVDGMPVNMRTHGHGQGWTDLNFLIPEAVEQLHYRKGTYYADVGDFSSAGSARFTISDKLPRSAIEVTAGSFGYLRGVAVGSIPLGSGDILYAGEAQAFDGPWTDVEENVRKKNGLLRYSWDAASGRAHLMVMGYHNRWNSPDQIPQRAVDQGLISIFGSIDETLGGEASRLSVSGGWSGPALGGKLDAKAYAIDSDLNLFSNFTYLLDDPLNGDQFRQVDERRLFGFDISQQWSSGRSRWSVGAEGRYDDIGRVGIFRTRARQPLETVREDAVKEASLGVFATFDFTFSEQLRAYLGGRYDRFHFDVTSKTEPLNSGKAEDGKLSLKGSLVYKPSPPLELYLSLGQGFHSNDARGTTIRVDPASGEPVERVNALVGSEGAEIGARLTLGRGVQATLAAWTLDLQSELLFVGDAGGTEARSPSTRKGIEAGLYAGTGSFSGEVEVSYTRARFRGEAAGADRIPGSIPLVVSGGVAFKGKNGFLASGRLRYFGDYPLIEDGSVKSDGSLLVNLRAGREWGRIGAYLDIFNLLNSRDHDVDYFYASRLSGEPAEGVEDIHFHVFQPRSARLSLKLSF